MENKLVYVPSSGGTNKVGNKLFTRLGNAVAKLRNGLYSNKDGVVTEYELVPTGKVFNSEGEEVE